MYRLSQKKAEMQEPNARTANAVLGQPVDGTTETENRGSSKTFCGGRLSGFCHRHRRYTVVLGGIFLYLPIGVPWYFGNLATYLTSYFRNKEGVYDEVVDPQWVFSAFFVSFSIAIVLSGYMANRIGTRATVTIAMFIHSGATYLSFVAVRHSMLALILTFGAVGGLGAGLAYGPPMPAVAMWLPRRVGMASGVLLTGFGGGAVFYNELITFYINPDNIRPDIHTERTSYFSQPEILDRIPELFLVMGSLTFVLQLVGVVLIRDPRDNDEIDAVMDITELTPTTDKTTAPSGNSNDCEKQADSKSIKSVSISEVKQLSPLEVLQTKDFYVLWLALGLNHYGYVIKNNYYKEFGARSIDNDHLLTSIGTVSTVAVAISRLFWGILADVVGIKLTIMVLMGCTTVFTAFWYWTILAGPGLYFAWVVIITWMLAGAFIVFPLAALSSFGQAHYASNYGLISTVQIAVNLMSPPIIKVLLDYFGWFGVFCSIAVTNLIGTIIMLFLSET